MSKLKTTVAACLAVAAIGGIIACSSQPAKSGGDAKSNSSPSAAAELAKGDGVPSLAEPSARAQVQTAGVPGSPGATTTISGKQLPPPDPRFGGVVKERASESKAWWPPRVVPPKGAPNVLLIMTDDVGFGARGYFRRRRSDPGHGSHREDRAALHEFPLHVALLALARGVDHRSQSPRGRLWCGGRNRDGIPGLRFGHPQGERHRSARSSRGTGTRPPGSARTTTRPSIRRPRRNRSTSGPTAWVSSTSTGFVGGDTSQWQPNLFRNTSAIYPFEGKPGWNLTTAMADEAIHCMTELKEVAPDKPFFVYYVPGGTHSPHHPTPEWTKKIGRLHLFDAGWNKLRETIFANQKRLGIMPDERES